MSTISGLFPRWLRAIGDPRRGDAPNLTYPINALLFEAVCMFVCRLGARRQIGLMMRTEACAKTFEALFGVARVAHGDTVDDVMCVVNPREVQETVCAMVDTLIRKKVLCSSRLLDKYYRVAVDGTGTVTFRERHCEHCLTRTHNGKTTYYHNVLEAKLVTPDGFAFSIMSEFIENSKADCTKQDCELNAFYRLAPRLKQRFPRLPIVLLMDALFAGGPVFELCQKNAWKFIINLKDDSLATVTREFYAVRKLSPENKFTWSFSKRGRIEQKMTWCNNIDYVDTRKTAHTVSVFECRETKDGHEEKSKTFRWISNITVKHANVEALANQGGRLRWKIENEGFNIQKTGGYELEHAYTRNPQGMKVYYFLLQIACILVQLIEKGSLLKKAFPKGLGSAKNLAWCLLEAFRNTPLDQAALERLRDTTIQIRFDTS